MEITSLPLNNCFSYRNVLEKGVNILSNMVLKKSVFCLKAQNIVLFGAYDLIQISPACSPKWYQIANDVWSCMERLQIYSVSICNGSAEVF